MLSQFLSIFLHSDKQLASVIALYGDWTYGILFFIIFCETGLVVMPFLPGDSLIFAAGALAAAGSLHFGALFFLLSVAAILGDTTNYSLGRFVGPRIFRDGSRLVNREQLLSAQAFYEKYGKKTIILARFVPIVRTFAPFLAGVSEMHYGQFLLYNVIGGIAWVTLALTAGYLFGGLPIVKDNFSIVILVIIAVSLLPGVVEYIKHKKEKQKSALR